MSKVVRTLFRETQDELMRLKELDPASSPPPSLLPLVVRASVRASPAQIEERFDKEFADLTKST